MRIRIPNWLVRHCSPLNAWLNETAARPRHYEIRRIDILLLFGFLACVTYYWVTSGWLGAFGGGLLYILITMMALWIF